MEKVLFIGFVIGFVLSSPIGPIGLLCLRRTLSRGISTGLISALGISFAYAFWSFVSIHGLKTVSHWIEQEKTILEAIIGLFFFLYGLHGIFNKPNTYYLTLQRKGGIAEFLSTFLVVLFNPSTFIIFLGLFALLGMTKSYHGDIESIQIALSVFCGSIVFWISLTQIIHKMRHKLNNSILNSISHLSSYVILIFSITILTYCLYEYFHIG